MDINDPRNPNNPNRPHPDLPPGMTTRDAAGSSMWPIVAVVAALIAGALYFGVWRTDQPNTQVGQNIERPAPKPNTTPGQPTKPQ
jgi:hypothetical protein